MSAVEQAAEFDIDLGAIEAELAKMTPEELKAQLVEIKARQKVATKKYYNPETAKKARLKKAAQVQAMMELAAKMGLIEQINKAATEEANRRLAAERATELVGDGQPEEEEEA